jgi:hypothetical protein
MVHRMNGSKSERPAHGLYRIILSVTLFFCNNQLDAIFFQIFLQ